MTSNEAWSYTNRAQITAALDAVPDRMCVIPPSGGYIGVWIGGREDEHRALIIRPGYLEWPGGRWTKDLPQDLIPEMKCEEDVEWHLLSTFRPHTGGPSSERPAAAVCPSCFMETGFRGMGAPRSVSV